MKRNTQNTIRELSVSEIEFVSGGMAQGDITHTVCPPPPVSVSKVSPTLDRDTLLGKKPKNGSYN